ALYTVVIQRDHAAVQAMLAQVDVHSPDLQQPLTSGFLEAAGRDASIAKLFLDANFDVNARDEDGNTALMVAARGEDTVRTPYVFDSFSDHEGDDCDPLCERQHPDLQIEFIESLHNVEQLLAHGAAVDAANHTGSTALLQAVTASGQPDIVRLLVQAKCNVVAIDDKGCMALHHAALRGQAENVRLLLTVHDPQDLQVTTADGDSVLYLACTSGNVEVVNLVMASSAHLHVDAANEDLQTPLMTAVIFDSLEIVQRLIQAHADVTMKDSFGMTALHHAVYSGANKDIVACLVDAKSDINNTCVDEMANTILHDAVTGSSLEVAAYLVKSGAAVDAVNGEGKTAAMLAHEVGRQDMVEFFESLAATP
ncbi:hypothetical protein AaE_004167, partial [Aphanomyces astaci]